MFVEFSFALYDKTSDDNKIHKNMSFNLKAE